MEYASSMGSGAMIHAPSFIKIGSGIQKLIWRVHRHTDSRDRIEYTLIFFNKESMLKKTMQSVNRLYLGVCFMGLSEGTALRAWSLQSRLCVFTVRYELST
jgi:hypothetical protein